MDFTIACLRDEDSRYIRYGGRPLLLAPLQLLDQHGLAPHPVLNLEPFQVSLPLYIGATTPRARSEVPHWHPDQTECYVIRGGETELLIKFRWDDAGWMVCEARPRDVPIVPADGRQRAGRRGDVAVGGVLGEPTDEDGYRSQQQEEADMKTLKNPADSPIPNAKRTEYFDHAGRPAYVEWEALDGAIPKKAVVHAGLIAVIAVVGEDGIGHATAQRLSDEGYALLEGMPGHRKTTCVRTFAESVGLTFRRIQFRPDMMPSDLIGKHQLRFDERRGPMLEWKYGLPCAAVVVADEINRASPRVQAATVEAMEERQIIRIDREEAEAVEYLERLGEVGMGLTYRGRPRLMERDAAVKIIQPRLATHAALVGRLLREAKMLASLKHSNIVRVYDADLVDGTLKYVPGGSLQQMSRFKLEVSEAGRLLYGLAPGLQYLHEQKFLHRDIKPSNLMVSPDLRETRIAELGLVRVLDASDALTREDETLGSADYIAPEQIRNLKDAGPGVDAYSPGCTLIHLLTGRPPFPGGTRVEKWEKHRSFFLSVFATQNSVELERTYPLSEAQESRFTFELIVRPAGIAHSRSIVEINMLPQPLPASLAAAQRMLTVGYDPGLMSSLEEVGGISTADKSLMIVAAVKHPLPRLGPGRLPRPLRPGDARPPRPGPAGGRLIGPLPAA